jgi:uncharacterized protein Yka (UPF0111/DUF47 family)
MPMTVEQMNDIIEQVDDHYQTVSDEAEANFKHAEFRDYPSDVTGDYRRDVVRMEKIYAKFHDFVEVIDEKGLDTKRANQFHALLDALYTSIDAVMHSNGMFRAFLEEGVAGWATGMFELLTALVKGQRKTVDSLIEDIEDIEKLIDKAKKDVRDARIQKGFNLALTAVSLCFPQLRAARAVFVALGTTGAKVIVDEFLGPSGPSTAGAIKSASLDYLGIADEVGKSVNVMATVYSTIDTYVTDDTELGRAEKTVVALRKKLAATEKALAQFQRLVKESEKDLVAFAIGLDKAVTAAHKARAAYASEKADRAELVGAEG